MKATTKQECGTAGRHTDVLAISNGALGPVPECSLDIRPFTVFVGPQGTGKSLVAQVLYSFEELPFLLDTAALERDAARKSSEDHFRWILDRLRSSERRFGTFANPNVHIQWSRSAPFENLEKTPERLTMRAYSTNRIVKVDGQTRRFLDYVLDNRIREQRR
ncbi:MAG: hypothetical protein V2A73_15285, partial [Pseudomonadota bacterium]